MLVASSATRLNVPAWIAERGMSPFSCPECRREVVLHKGLVRAHHFKHKPPINCPYGLGESDQHYKAKKGLYDALSGLPNLSKFEIEYRLDGARPDVYFELKIPACRVAIELQKSSQTLEEVARRTSTYAKLGVSVIWIFPFNEPHWVEGEPGVCKAQSWERYFHSMFYGRVYFWQAGRMVRAAHFAKVFRDVPQGNWVEDIEEKIGDDLSGTRWYQEHHDDADYGGGTRFVKSHKTVLWAPQPLDLSQDFDSTARQQFRDVPACRIWLDRLRSW